MLNSQIIIKYSRTRLDACNHARSASCIYNCIPPTTRSFFFEQWGYSWHTFVFGWILLICSILLGGCEHAYIQRIFVAVTYENAFTGCVWPYQKFKKLRLRKLFIFAGEGTRKRRNAPTKWEATTKQKCMGGRACVSVCVYVGIYLSERNMTAPRRLHKTIWVEARK